MLTFTFPIDGDVITRADGRIVSDQLYHDRIAFTAVLRGEPNRRVTLRGKPAVETEPGVYACEVTTDGVRTTLTADCDNGDSACIVVYRFEKAWRKYRLAIDDIIWSMKELADRAPFIDSIFEVPFFAIFRDLNAEFGTKTQLNIYYHNADKSFNLTMVPDKFRDEFEKNAPWLKWTFHAIANDPPSIYKYTPYDEVYRDYWMVQNEISRFAGDNVNSTVNGLHYCEITRDGARALRSVGIRTMSGYYVFNDKGEPAVSYYLDKEQTEHCAHRDFWVDRGEDIVFTKDKMVIDHFAVDKIEPRLNELLYDLPHESGTMNFVTHEQYFYPYYSHYQPDYRTKIFTCARWCAEHGFEPCFLDDVVEN